MMQKIKNIVANGFKVSDKIFGDNDTEKDQLTYSYFHEDTLEKS
jgi:hypothetical protein